MSRRQSLRFRLGALVGGLAVALSMLAAVLFGVVGWQNQNEQLDDAVRLAAFQLAETDTAELPIVDVENGGDTFAVLFDLDATVVARTGDLPDALVEALVDDVWQFTIDNGNAVSAEVTDFDAVASGAFCTNNAVCDTAVVGAYRQPLGDYIATRWWWYLAAPVLVGGAALALSRWLVARSLAPVDLMRAELDEITESDLERRVPVPASNDELATLGRSLNATIGRLGDAFAANERFVADAAHELRSPITGARAAFEIAGGSDPDDLVADGLGELDRASRLIDDLLVLARHQSSPHHGNDTDVDLDDLARAVVATSRLQWPDVKITSQPEPVRIRTDAEAVRRIITNLIDNACRYGTHAVAVKVARTDEAALILVDDDGPGIPPEHHDHVFQRFVRLDESRTRETGGSGLGLAIVAELIDGLGGSVWVEESPTGGARVGVRLPPTHDVHKN